MKVYLVVGAEMHESMAAALEKNGFDIIGYDYTIDAAAINLKRKLSHPDLFIINGLAQASGASEGVINRNRSLLVKLKDIRMAAPQSRILLLLPGETPPGVIHGIVSLGIYDIHQTSSFDEQKLLDWIKRPMSIADFDQFHIGQVPDSAQGEIHYGPGKEGNKQKPYLQRTLAGLQSGKGLVSKITSSFGDSGENSEPVAVKRTNAVGRKRAGKPVAVLGIGDTRIEDWIKEYFSDQMEVAASAAEPEEIKRKVDSLFPDILILMRQSVIGGVPGADELSVWAAGRVPAVLFIVGELDDAGKGMVDRARDAGVRHLIFCEKGGYISGDELVYVLTNVIREMQGSGPAGGREEAGGPFNGEAGKTINSLLQGAGAFGRALKQSAESVTEKGRVRAAKKKKSPRINMYDGLALEEKTPRQVYGPDLKDPTAIVPGGIMAVVSPWRPNLAGRLAAQAVKIFAEVEGSEVAYIGASKDSTGAVWLNISPEELMMSDWRVPGSICPIMQDNLRIYAVDPSKDLQAGGDTELWSIVKQARKISTYTVLDFAGDMSSAQKAAHQGRAVVLVVLPGSDPVEYGISAMWLRNFMEGKQNIVTGIDLRGVPNSVPEELRPKVVIRNNPADALASVLKKSNDDEFIWN